MENKKITKCSICGETDHNKRTCPHKPIDDIRPMEKEYIEEKVDISYKKELLMKDLLEREAYEIHPQLFTMWLISKRPIDLKELKYVYDKGFNKDSLKLYLELVNMIEEYY